MREIRPSGSEGGAAQHNAPPLPLSGAGQAPGVPPSAPDCRRPDLKESRDLRYDRNATATAKMTPAPGSFSVPPIVLDPHGQSATVTQAFAEC